MTETAGEQNRQTDRQTHGDTVSHISWKFHVVSVSRRKCRGRRQSRHVAVITARKTPYRVGRSSIKLNATTKLSETARSFQEDIRSPNPIHHQELSRWI